jgi:hypothetical protein
MRLAGRPLATLVGMAVGAAALVVGAPAHAFERQWHFGASFGYAALFGANNANGFGGGLHAAYGVSDYFNVIGEVDVTEHPSPKWTIVSGGLGAAYVFDVLRWVPWIGAEVGPAGLVSTDPACGSAKTEACTALRLNAAIPFGLDYGVTRSFNVGIGGRFQVLLLNGSPWETLGIFARAEYVWGY